MIVRPVRPTDAAAICEIYNHYVLTSVSTFEVESVGVLEMGQRISECLVAGYPYLVAEDADRIVGYAYAHSYRPRPAYKNAVETSVYVAPGENGRGCGSVLYRQLIHDLFCAGFHTILAGIALPNDASVHLHEKFGFNKVAHFREVGRKFDRWIDVGFWQLVYDSDRS